MQEKGVNRITAKSIRELYQMLLSNNILIELLVSDITDKKLLELLWLKNLRFDDAAKELALSRKKIGIRYNNLLKKIQKRITLICDNYTDLLALVNAEETKNKFIKKQVKALEQTKMPVQESTAEDINPKNIFIADVVSTRSRKLVQVLQNKNIYTLGNLTFYTEKELLLIPGLGDYFVKQLKAIMLTKNLHLKKQRRVKNATLKLTA